MPIMILALLAVLVLAVVVIAIVVMGMEGTGREKHPEIAHAMARTARHLNGEGEPPKALLTLFDEAAEVPQIDVRELPNRIRSMRSARSAASSASADVPEEFSAQPATEPGAEPLAASEADEVEAATETVEAAQAPGTPADAADETDEDARPVQRSGKRKRKGKKGGGKPRQDAAAPQPSTEAVDSALEEGPDADVIVIGRRPSADELNDTIAAALAAPALDSPAAADPYGVWGADELDPEPAEPVQRVHLGRRR